MVDRTLSFLLFGLLTTAVFAELQCVYEVQIPCVNATTADSAISDPDYPCLCEEFENETCSKPEIVTCYNNAYCDDDVGCHCNPCFQGPTCEEPANPNAPIFEESSYSLEIQRGIKSEIPSLRALDADSVECNIEEFPVDCDCARVKYRLKDTKNGRFKMDEDTGDLLLNQTDGGHLQFDLEVVAYNPVQGNKKPTSVDMKVKILEHASAAAPEDPDKSVEKKGGAEEGILDAVKAIGSYVDSLFGKSEAAVPVSSEEPESTEPDTRVPESQPQDQNEGNEQLTEQLVSEVKQAIQKPAGDRNVKMFTISGDQIVKHDSEHRRVKRGAAGAGVPDDYTFTLTALSNDGKFSLGEKISYKLAIHANSIETDVQVEIFSELSGGAFFMISNVRITLIGSNFENFTSDNKEILYKAKYDDGRWDFASLDLGTLVNSVADATTEAASQIEIQFDIQSLKHDALVVDNSYRVSVGLTYLSDAFVTVAQDDLIYEDYTPGVTVDATFEVTGPDSLGIGFTGIWTINCSVYDLYTTLSLDVLAPLSSPGVMRIDRISVVPELTGDFWRYTAVSDDGSNFTRTTYEEYGNYARLDLGTIMNAGYLSNNPNDDVAKNQLVFEVAITILDTPGTNLTHPYKVGFTVWRRDMNQLEVMWAALADIQAVEQTATDLVTHPQFSLETSASTVKVGGRVGVLLNISIPLETSAIYTVELSLQVNDSQAMMRVDRHRVSKIGFNMPHLEDSLDMENITSASVDGVSVDALSWNLGLITNTGQRDGADDQIVQVEFSASLLEDVLLYYSVGDEIYITAGVASSNELYYWVGRVPITIGEDIIYPAEMVPEFTLKSAMGEDSTTYRDGAVVFDLDMFVPAGTDLDYVNIDFSTSYGNLSNTLETQFKVLSFEIPHVGAAIHLEYNRTSFTSYGDVDEDGMAFNGAGTLMLNRVTNLQSHDYERYRYSDFTIRFRLIAITRKEATSLINGETYYTEFSADLEDSYIFAGRIGVVFNESEPSMYTGRHWQPTLSVTIDEGFSTTLIRGGIVSYTMEVGIPYQTVTDLLASLTSFNDSLKVCSIRQLSRGSALVHYDAKTYLDKLEMMKDEQNWTYSIEHYTPVISSYGYGIFDGDNLDDSYVTYQVVAGTTLDAEFNVTYSGAIGAQFSNASIVTEPINFYIQEPTVTEGLPYVTMGHMGATNKINLGGSEMYYLDIYVPPGMQGFLQITFLAPYNVSFTGEYEIFGAYHFTSGDNLPCSMPLSANFELSSSIGSNTSYDTATATVTSGSLALDGDTVIDENKMRFAVHVGLSQESTLLVGDYFPIAASVKVDDQQLWIGYFDTEVAEVEFNGNANATKVPSVEVEAIGSSTVEIGGVVNYTATLSIPPGSAYTDTTLRITSPIGTDQEAYILVYGIEVVSAGVNLQSGLRQSEISYEQDLFGQDTTGTVSFGFLRNIDLAAYQTDYGEKAADNQIKVEFSVRVLDHLDLTDHSLFPFEVQVTHLSGVVSANMSGSEIEVVTYENDNANFVWNATIVNSTQTVYPHSQVSFSFELELSETSRRFPTDVTFNFRVPSFSRLDQINSFDGMTPTSMPVVVSETGLEFTWSKMRYGDNASVSFTITLDPDNKMKPGLYYRYISIPLDITYTREDKHNLGTFDEWFSDMRVLTFEIYVPECLQELGMQDGRILDCQITASSSNEIGTPEYARFNSSFGWMSLPRGPPYYQNEFIQVDFSTIIKFTGVTIQPNKDTDISRTLTFKMKYSKEGIRWEDARNDGMLPKTFTVTWPQNPSAGDYIFMPFGNMTFTGKHVRIYPQTNSLGGYQQGLRFEIHGCVYKFGEDIEAYTCPTSDSSLLPYAERNWLVDTHSGSFYICVLDKPGGEPYCSGTDTQGTAWFPIDNNVMNMYGRQNSTDFIYAIARNRKSYLRSRDGAHSWTTVPISEVTAAASSDDWTHAADLPFADFVDLDVHHLFAQYGVEWSPSESVAVSETGVHVFSLTGQEIIDQNKTDSEGKIAYWGTKAWDGP